jgi:hypothetical protein
VFFHYKTSSAALLLAADRTANVRQPPKPFYCRSNFPHFYVEYTLLARLGNEKLRTAVPQPRCRRTCDPRLKIHP